jgi:hypothetical protein
MLSNAPKMRRSPDPDARFTVASRPDVARFHNYAPWANVALGVTIFVLHYVSPRGSFAVSNLFLTSLVVVFAATAATIAHDCGCAWNCWSSVNIAAGVWLIVSVYLIPGVFWLIVAQTSLGAAVCLVALVSLGTEMFGGRAKRRRRGALR